MKNLRLIQVLSVTSFTLLTTLFLPSSAMADPSEGDTSAVCDLTFTERFDPGLTLVPSSGHQDSPVDSGTITCVGKIQGREVTGPGTVWNEGRYVDSTCLFDHAEGRYFFTVPTNEGPISVNGTFVIDRVGPVLSVHLEQRGAHGEGAALVIPTQGDCVLNPVTQALVVMSIKLKDADSTVTARCALDLGVVLISCRT